MNLAELSAWERIYLAMQVGVRDPLLLTQLKKEVLDLLDPESLLLLAALIAVTTLGAAWGGPAAWVAEMGVAAAGLWYLGRDLVTIISNMATFVKLAVAAKTDDDIKAAGHEFALALSRLGSTAIMSILSAGAFKAARSLLVPRLKSAMGNRATAPEPRPTEAKASAEKRPERPTDKPVEKSPTDNKAPPAETSLAKKVATAMGEGGVARPVSELSLAQVLLPIGLIATAAGVGAVLLLKGRSQEVKVRVVSAA